MFDFKDRVAIVINVACGIGEATAWTFVKRESLLGF